MVQAIMKTTNIKLVTLYEKKFFLITFKDNNFFFTFLEEFITDKLIKLHAILIT